MLGTSDIQHLHWNQLCSKKTKCSHCAKWNCSKRASTTATPEKLTCKFTRSEVYWTPLWLWNMLFAKICLCEHLNSIVRPQHLERHEIYVWNLFVYCCMSVFELLNQNNALQHINSFDFTECTASYAGTSPPCKEWALNSSPFQTWQISNSKVRCCQLYQKHNKSWTCDLFYTSSMYMMACSVNGIQLARK